MLLLMSLLLLLLLGGVEEVTVGLAGVGGAGLMSGESWLAVAVESGAGDVDAEGGLWSGGEDAAAGGRAE